MRGFSTCSLRYSDLNVCPLDGQGKNVFFNGISKNLARVFNGWELQMSRIWLPEVTLNLILVISKEGL